MTRRHGHRRAERGATLVLVVLLVFGVLGLAAAVVDLGLARATQASMQNAADVAAVEGLRLRDDVPGDPVGADVARRLAASRAAARVFDEDGELGTENVDLLLSLGPSRELVGGVGALNAGAQIVVGDALLPALEANEPNLPHGDLVAGTHLGGPSAETAEYLRDDFAVVPPEDAPTASAFLARLRRTHDPLGLDAVAGVSSSAPGLPYVFGQGSGIVASDTYDPRRDGITVRATAIADARAALRCGPAQLGAPGLLEVGVALGESLVLALDVASWNDTACLGEVFVARVASSGQVRALSPGSPCDGTTIGRVATLDASLAVGDVGPAGGVATSPGASVAPLGYVPLTITADGAAQVAGFGAVEVVSVSLSSAEGGPTLADVTLRRAGAVVAPINGSAHDRGARVALTLDPALAAAHASIAAPLLAPVLVR